MQKENGIAVNGVKTIDVLQKDKFNIERVVDKLENVMDGITAQELNAQNVSAACQVVDRIVDLINVDMDVTKLKLQMIDLNNG